MYGKIVLLSRRTTLSGVRLWLRLNLWFSESQRDFLKSYTPKLGAKDQDAIEKWEKFHDPSGER